MGPDQFDSLNHSNRKQKIWLRLFLMLIFTVILLYFIFKNLPFSSLMAGFKEISIFNLILAGASYFVCLFFRSLRFYLILEKELSFKKVFGITSFNNFTNNILPLRLGELSYIYLAKKEGIKSTRGVFTLGIVRIFDIAVIFLFFSIALLFTHTSNYFFNLFAIILFIILLSLLFLVIFFRRTIFNSLQSIHLKTEKIFLRKILENTLETLNNFIILKSRKNLWYLAITSILVWIFAFGSGYFIVSDLLPISFFVVILGLCFAMLTYILPIQGLMGFGTTEGAWALVLIYFGFTSTQALSTGFAFHLWSLFYSILFGLYFLIEFIISKKN